MIVIAQFDQVTRKVKDWESKDGFYQEKKNLTIISPVGSFPPVKLQQYQYLNYLLPVLCKRVRNPRRKFKESLKLLTGLTVN